MESRRRCSPIGTAVSMAHPKEFDRQQECCFHEHGCAGGSAAMLTDVVKIGRESTCLGGDSHSFAGTAALGALRGLWNWNDQSNNGDLK